MTKATVLYLSANMMNYRSSSYQQDVMDELARQANVFFYGPGFPDYDINDSIDDVLAKAAFDPHSIILGHSWLNDEAGAEVDPHPKLGLANTDIRKIAILNKEYVNLNAKLDYVRASACDVAFTHHHDVAEYSRETGIKFVFWPFAYAHRRYSYDGKKKSVDVAFIGILQNPNKHSRQSDVRVRIMKEFFWCIGDLPVAKRKQYSGLCIAWNAHPRSNNLFSYSVLGRIFNEHRYRYLEQDEYCELQRTTKIYINTLSPIGIVSPRYFESMAAKTLVFCEESDLYRNIFPQDVYVTYKNDLCLFCKSF